MSDNVSITAGSGTTVAADDIGGVLYQRVKISQGADGSGTDVSSAAPLQVTLANTGSNATAVKVDGSSVTQPVSLATNTPILTPTTSGGLTTYHLVSAGSTNATNIKASAGQVYGWYIYNSNAAARKVVFHNNAGSPTAGASVFFALMIPPTSGANMFTDTGIPFSSGIAITTVTDLADSGTTAVSANDLIINIFYK